MRCFLITALAFLVVGGAVAARTVQDLNEKKGNVLYTASYTNSASTRTRATYFGNYTSYDGSTTTPFGNNVRATALFNVQVKDKKTNTMPWTNLLTVTIVEFPPSVVPPSVALGTDALTAETYQLTALDKDSKALLGSLVFGATWSDGSDLDDVIMTYPVLGASGVYKSAKSVRFEYGTDGSRAVTIFKTAL